MVFSNFARSESSGQILFKNTNPIENVKSIKFYKDNASGYFSKREFRWSFNNSYWSSWESLNQGNLTSISTLGKKYLFVEVRYIGTGKVTSFSITYDEGYVQPPAPSYADTSTIKCTPEYISSCPPINVPNDCNTLNGKNGEFYLWRGNHKGQQPISSITGLSDILNYLENNVVSLSYVDGSLYLRDVSINELYEYLALTNNDVSLLLYDVSSLYTNGVAPNLYVRESSLNLSSGFAWENGLLYVDVSVVAGGVSLSYVDGSFGARDLSINWLYERPYILDSCIGFGLYWNQGILDVSVEGKNYDASLNDLYTNKVGTASNVTGGDASVFMHKVDQDLVFRSIKTDNSILSISNDSSFVHINFLGFDVLDGGNNWTTPSDQIDGGSW